ncbi:MAG: 30S ribosomal protein S20 [Candidatus Nanoperiomorbaceae bacterium]
MPIIKSAVKKMKQDQRRYAQNIRTKRAIRVAVKELETTLTYESFKKAQSAIDTAVKKNVFSKAAAARRLSHLAKFAKENGVKIVAKPATPKAPAKKVVAPKKSATTAVKPASAKKAPAKKPVAKTTAKTPAAKAAKK